MNQLQILNCPRVQDILLRYKLLKAGISQGEMIIEFQQEIVSGKCNCLWYGGDIVTITYKDIVYHIAAVGDVIASLQAKDDLHELARVKDKSNNGIFMDEMRGYIKDDARLDRLLQGNDPKNVLNIESGNWLEVYTENEQGEWCDALDSDSILDGIIETVSLIKETAVGRIADVN